MNVYKSKKYSYVTIAEIPKNEIKKIDFALCAQPRETLKAFYDRQSVKPDLLVNAGFFSMADGTTCFNYVNEGKQISSHSMYQWGMGVVGDNDLTYGSLSSRKWRDFISGYPNLIDGGQKVKINFATELNYRARRTMVGYNNTTIYVVCVDSPGLAFNDMQNVMYDLGCTFAINLDGGGSTRMLHNGEVVTEGIENRAVDNCLAIYLNDEDTKPKPNVEQNSAGTPKDKNNMISCFKGKFRVTSIYGTRTLFGATSMHNGLDLVGIDDTNVYAPCDGVIGASTIVTNKSDLTWEWGNFIRLDTKDNHSIFMCHLASRSVVVGKHVKKGDKLGVMGTTGLSTGAHTHFEVRKYGTRTVVNPSEYTGIPNILGIYESELKTASANSVDVMYQVYSKGKWWEEVVNYNDNNSDGYAGVPRYPIQALKIHLSNGSIKYRVHTKNVQWWDWITDNTGTGYNAYAGVLGRDIDMIQMKLVGDIANKYKVKYRVSSLGKAYFNWVDGDSTTDYAGMPGYSIDKIQIGIEKK